MAAPGRFPNTGITWEWTDTDGGQAVIQCSEAVDVTNGTTNAFDLHFSDHTLSTCNVTDNGGGQFELDFGEDAADAEAIQLVAPPTFIAQYAQFTVGSTSPHP